MSNPDSIVVCLLSDDPSQLEATSRVLSSEGWRTHPFTDPNTFLKYASNCSPDVAILDFGGAHGRGLQIRAQLRDVSPKTWTVIGLKPHHNPARDVLSDNELINLIKQYVGASRKRLFPKRRSYKRRETTVGLGV